MNSVLTVREAIARSSSLLGAKVWVRGVLVITSNHCHLSSSRALRNDLSGSIAINPKIRGILDDKTGGTWFLVGGDAFYLCDSEIQGTLACAALASYHLQFTSIASIALIDHDRGRRTEVAIDAV